MNKERKMNPSVQIIFSIIQIISGIAFILTFSRLLTIFGSEIVLYMNGVWLLGIFIVILSTILFVINGKILFLWIKTKKVRSADGVEIQESSKTKEIAEFISVSWHLLLGLIFLLLGIVAPIAFWDDIKGYLSVVSTLVIFVIGIGSAMIFSSINYISKKRKKLYPQLMPGLTAFGVVFFLILPAGGIYYYFDFILPQKAWEEPMNRGPILIWFGESDTNTTMGVFWDSVEKMEDPELKWGTISGSLDKTGVPNWYSIYAPIDPDDGNFFDGDPIGYRYYYEITGLSVNTTYYYQVTDFSEEKSFKTARNIGEKYSFQVLGDNRNSGGIHRLLVELMETYESEFTINEGDICNEDQFWEWNEFLDDIKGQAGTKPYLIAPGNHESGPNNEIGYYFNYVGSYDSGSNLYSPERNYFSYNYSNAHFLIIDTENSTQEMLDFIEEDLQRNAGKHDWIIANFHAPIFSTGGHNYNEGWDEKFLGNFTKYGVDIVLTGHDHHYESFNVSKQLLEEHTGETYAGGNGMLHIVSGGGGVSLRTSMLSRDVEPWLEETQNATEGRVYQTYFPLGATAETKNWTVADILVYAEISHQFIQFDVDGKNLDITSIRLDGSIIEEFHLKK